MKLSIVIPAYNEEQRLPRMLDVYVPFFEQRMGGDYELVIVPNNCKDRTAELAMDYARRWPQIRVFEERGNVGKGGAVMIGMRHAAGDLIGFVDADGATPPGAFLDLVEHIGDAGAIIGSRYAAGANVHPKQPLKRRFVSRIFNLLVRLLFKVRISDTQCGAKVFTRDAVQAILPRLGVTRWAFDVDVLFQLRRAGFTIVERPTTWHDVTGSRLEVTRASAEMLLAIMRLRLTYSNLRFIVRLYDLTIARLVRVRR